jgi:hypothetical protein
MQNLLEGMVMQYMLLIVTDLNPPLSQAPMGEILEAHRKFSEELTKQGKLVSASRLRPPSEAKTVRFVGGKKLVVDGPFTETKEGLGGYYMIECDCEAEAIEWAKRLPASCVQVQGLWPV